MGIGGGAIGRPMHTRLSSRRRSAGLARRQLPLKRHRLTVLHPTASAPRSRVAFRCAAAEFAADRGLAVGGLLLNAEGLPRLRSCQLGFWR